MEFWLRRKAESDPEFRAEIARVARRGLLVIGFVEAGMTALSVLAKLSGLTYPHEGELRLGALFAFLLLSALAFTGYFFAPLWPYARTFALLIGLSTAALMAVVDVSAMERYRGVAATLDQVTVLLVGLATIPATPMHFALLGLSSASWYGWLAASAPHLAQIPHSERNVLPLAVLSILCAILAGINYGRLYTNWRTHRDALRASGEARESELRTCQAENAASTLRLAAALSHELNTPLGSLRSATDTMVRASARLAGTMGPAAEAQARSLAELGGVIQNAAARLEEMVRRMQRFTNLDRAEVSEIDLNRLLEDVVALHGPEDRARLELNLQPVPPFNAQPQALSGVLSGLLHYALQSSKGAKVQVGSKLYGHEAELTIGAEGAAVGAVASAASGFDPEFSVQNGKMRSGNWALFSARQVIRAHGGDVAFDGNGGSRIVVRLPLRSREENMAVECTHLDQVKDVRPNSQGCEECLKTGSRWVHLRLCRTCGHVGCCDSSPNRHATKHFRKTAHPIIQSLEPGEDWGWCNIDSTFIEGRYLNAAPRREG